MVGGITTESALANLRDMTTESKPISESEFQERLGRLQSAMQEQGVDAIFFHASSNLRYFTGLVWHPSERMVGAIVPANGDIIYICPKFETDTLQDFWVIPAEIRTWEEHESPYELVRSIIAKFDVGNSNLAIDPFTPFFSVDGMQKACSQTRFLSAESMLVSIRSIKTESEIALIRRAHQMTLEVHRAAASILRPGITTTEVEAFIDKAHQKVGASGSSFCIVLFGVATSFPHGVKDPQTLKENDWVLVDTGCLLDGYHSDITRTYPFGDPTQEQAQAWAVEKQAQVAAFEAAAIGVPCENCDQAARDVLEAAGYGPDYQLPGLPHRTGHGCGLDIHESPNLVRGEKTPLKEGMVFSSEPMLVLPGKFGVRLEDHFYMTSQGPEWFTEPADSIESPI